MGLYQLKNVKSCAQRWSHIEANRALLFGGSLALALLPGLTSRSKGRAARWRFWGLVFYRGSAASFRFC